jgi:hypothetical protein
MSEEKMPDPIFRVGEVATLCGLKKKQRVRIISREFREGVWFYAWTRDNYAAESMLIPLTEDEWGNYCYEEWDCDQCGTRTWSNAARWAHEGSAICALRKTRQIAGARALPEGFTCQIFAWDQDDEFRLRHFFDVQIPRFPYFRKEVDIVRMEENALIERGSFFEWRYDGDLSLLGPIMAKWAADREITTKGYQNKTRGRDAVHPQRTPTRSARPR